MLARIGLSAVPAAEAIKCDDFKDYLRVMYCLNPQQLNARFLRVMIKIAKTIGLTDGFLKFNETPVQAVRCAINDKTRMPLPTAINRE
jgi:hypothetical protein